MTPPANTAAQPGKKDRREQARETARLEREAEKRRQRRNRFFLQGGIGLAVIVIVVVIVLVIVNVNKPAGPGPKNMASAGILFTGKDGNPVPTLTKAAPKNGPVTPLETSTTDGVAHITTYVDWACPVCQQFETQYATDLSGAVAQGAATLDVHPIAILDRSYQGSRYSSRAANAAACIANYDPTQFLDAQNAFYAGQPAEGSTGLTNSQMKALLKSAGIDNAKVNSCIDNESFKSWVSDVTTRTVTTAALVDPSSGSFGTPTVFVNGQRWDNKTEFLSFVQSVIGGGQ